MFSGLFAVAHCAFDIAEMGPDEGFIFCSG
jgi:hypothetical protein